MGGLIGGFWAVTETVATSKVLASAKMRMEEAPIENLKARLIISPYVGSGRWDGALTDILGWFENEGLWLH